MNIVTQIGNLKRIALAGLRGVFFLLAVGFSLQLLMVAPELRAAWPNLPLATAIHLITVFVLAVPSATRRGWSAALGFGAVLVFAIVGIVAAGLPETLATATFLVVLAIAWFRLRPKKTTTIEATNTETR